MAAKANMCVYGLSQMLHLSRKIHGRKENYTLIKNVLVESYCLIYFTFFNLYIYLFTYYLKFMATAMKSTYVYAHTDRS